MDMRRRTLFGLAILTAAVTLTARPAHADAQDPAEPFDHDAVMIAVARGEIRPLADLLEMVRGKLPGEITGIEIERKQNQWVYEFHVVDKHGRLFEVYVDAMSGDIKSIKDK
jgi:uncharacterized membrane protein YkoI